MSASDWSYFASLGVVGALGVLAAIGPLVVRIEPERQTAEAQAYEQTQEPIQLPSPVDAKSNQTAPDQRSAADLEAQQRMANAADRSIGISILALLGLGFTVLFACLAWLAAKDSAKADNEALRLTRKQLRMARKAEQRNRFIAIRQSRAYVQVTAAWIDRREQAEGFEETVLREPSSDPNEPVFKSKLILRVENAGQTATTTLSYHIEIDQETTTSTLIPRPLSDSGANRKISNLAPESRRVFDAKNWSLDKALSDYKKEPRKGPVGAGLLGRLPDVLTFRGRVRYTDVFGKRIESHFGFWCYEPAAGYRTKLIPMDANFAVYAEVQPSAPPRRRRLGPPVRTSGEPKE